MKRKVCVVVTARPSYSRIKTALQAIRDHGDLELQLVVAASALLDRYGSVVNQIEEDGFLDKEVYVVNLDKPNLEPIADQYAVDYDLLPFFLIFDQDGPSYGETLTFQTPERVKMGNQVVPTLMQQAKQTQDMFHAVDMGQGINMQDLKPIEDEIAEEHQ